MHRHAHLLSKRAGSRKRLSSSPVMTAVERYTRWPPSSVTIVWASPTCTQ